MTIAKEKLIKEGFEIVEFKLTSEEIYDIRRIYLGLVLNYFMGPSLDNLNENYEEMIPSYRFVNSYFENSWFFRNYTNFKLKMTGQNRSLKRLQDIKVLP